MPQSYERDACDGGGGSTAYRSDQEVGIPCNGILVHPAIQQIERCNQGK